VASIKQD